jgi:RNA polymerase sigma factor (sigma-70 family)
VAARRLTEEQRETVASVWDAYRPFVEAVARRHLNGQADHLPDVVQNVGLAVCSHFHGFRGAGGLRTWIFRITVHEVRRVQRQAVRHGRIVDALTLEPAYPEAQTPHEHLERTQTIQAVREALNTLRPAYREILRDDSDGSGLYTSDGAKRSLRYRARKELRSLIDRSNVRR